MMIWQGLYHWYVFNEQMWLGFPKIDSDFLLIRRANHPIVKCTTHAFLSCQLTDCGSRWYDSEIEQWYPQIEEQASRDGTRDW